MPIDAAGVWYLLLTGVLLPWMAYRSLRRLDAGRTMPVRSAIFTQGIVLQAILAPLGLYVCSHEGIELLGPPSFGPRDLLAGGAWLAVTLGSLPLRWKSASDQRRRRLYSLVPRTTRERVFWIAVCLAAGVGEEITFRGAMFSLVMRLVDHWWLAATLCSLAFAILHAVQGPRAAAAVFIFALGFHLLVRITGALYIAMTVHFIYDLVAGLVFGVLGRELYEKQAAEAQPA